MMRLTACLFALTLWPLAGGAQDVPDSVVRAIQLADEGDYTGAVTLADDALARDLVDWMTLRGGGRPFAEYQDFMTRRPDWPGLDRLRARGEREMSDATRPDVIRDWFETAPPETGEGAVWAARALKEAGEDADADQVLRDAWLGLRLTNSGHAAMIAAFDDTLAPLHWERAQWLLWGWRTDEATRMLPLLTEDQAALAAARIAYIRKSGISSALENVPAALLDDAGLAYDRYNWLANRGERTQAVEILRERSGSAETLGEPFRWSGWRRSLARWEMREGRAQSAYDLASRHFLTEGASFADLEWLSGYLSLRYLDAPARALEHFETFEAAVDSPISLGRAGYWKGRAYEVLGDANAAAVAYAMASDHQTGFYGLLAAEQLGMSLDPVLTGRDDPVDWTDADVFDRDLVKAALALLKAGERGSATTFFAELGRQLDATQTAQLAAYMVEQDQSYYAVLLGKAAARRGIIVPSAYFPLHGVAEMDLPAPKALSLSIARRESEFNAGAGSPVGALGLMQLMPATAEEVAGFVGVPYSRGRLTSDWSYNATLGARYLAELAAQFGPSVVQIAAGYNAGPSRPLAWMDARGDPRLGEIDVIDWIENIPFRETRNYVMRVSESIPVYEARLTGETGPVRFRALLVGEKLLVRPQMRPEIPFAVPQDGALPPVAPQGASGVRPLPRPGD